MDRLNCDHINNSLVWTAPQWPVRAVCQADRISQNVAIVPRQEPGLDVGSDQLRLNRGIGASGFGCGAYWGGSKCDFFPYGVLLLYLCPYRRWCALRVIDAALKNTTDESMQGPVAWSFAIRDHVIVLDSEIAVNQTKNNLA